MPKSLQDLLKQRRSSNFVGREQQLELFRQNLRRSPDSEDYYFIFSVHGQGGVGKTTLLKKYCGLAKGVEAPTTYREMYKHIFVQASRGEGWLAA